jgi:hypothetical protein
MTDWRPQTLDADHDLVDSDEKGIVLQRLDEAYPEPSLASVVMTLEDHGIAPIDGQQDWGQIQRAYWELGSWLIQNNPHTRTNSEDDAQ